MSIFLPSSFCFFASLVYVFLFLVASIFLFHFWPACLLLIFFSSLSRICKFYAYHEAKILRRCSFFSTFLVLGDHLNFLYVGVSLSLLCYLHSFQILNASLFFIVLWMTWELAIRLICRFFVYVCILLSIGMALLLWLNCVIAYACHFFCSLRLCSYDTHCLRAVYLCTAKIQINLRQVFFLSWCLFTWS